MKSWLIKFKISNALNERKPFTPETERAMKQSAEIHRFAESSTALDQALKHKFSKATTDPTLHDSIMRVVRSANRASVAENRLNWPRLVPISAALLLILLGIEFFPKTMPAIPIENTTSLAAASSTLELGNQLMRELPVQALSPLSDEMQSLDQHLANTKEFLLACLP